MMNFFGFFMHGGDEHIDLAPLVDIAFLLLTFFMMTTTFKTSDEVKLQLPTSTSEQKEPASRFITVTVGDSATGSQIVFNADLQHVRQKALSVKGVSETDALRTTGFEVTKEELYGILNVARQVEPNQKIVLKADRYAKFGLVQEIMLIMKKVNFKDVQLMTDVER
ncbi:MAG: biopolymer transporter ExbD [Chlorobiales bacterium]|nr:biopolymer transporter ExbD [Chlorobiales bacterium]